LLLLSFGFDIVLPPAQRFPPLFLKDNTHPHRCGHNGSLPRCFLPFSPPSTSHPLLHALRLETGKSPLVSPPTILSTHLAFRCGRDLLPCLISQMLFRLVFPFPRPRRVAVLPRLVARSLHIHSHAASSLRPIFMARFCFACASTRLFPPSLFPLLTPCIPPLSQHVSPNLLALPLVFSSCPPFTRF